MAVLSKTLLKIEYKFYIKCTNNISKKRICKKLTSIFRKVGIEIDGIVPNTLVERNLILDNNELTDNIMLLDIGAGNTDIGVFEGSSFVYTNTTYH